MIDREISFDSEREAGKLREVTRSHATYSEQR